MFLHPLHSHPEPHDRSFLWQLHLLLRHPVLHVHPLLVFPGSVVELLILSLSNSQCYLSPSHVIPEEEIHHAGQAWRNFSTYPAPNRISPSVSKMQRALEASGLQSELGLLFWYVSTIPCISLHCLSLELYYYTAVLVSPIQFYWLLLLNSL